MDNSGQAFPSVGEGFGDPRYSTVGLTKREWFAGMALQGMLSSNAKFHVYEGEKERECQSLEDFSFMAFSYADAMIAAGETHD